MTEIKKLMARREAILKEVASLEQMRRGSITEQYIETVSSDGKTKKRTGPYFLYTYKDNKRTVSRRITDKPLVPVYREQIQSFRRFQELVSELRNIGEKIGDLSLRGEEDVKKTKSSRSREKPK